MPCFLSDEIKNMYSELTRHWIELTDAAIG